MTKLTKNAGGLVGVARLPEAIVVNYKDGDGESQGRSFQVAAISCNRCNPRQIAFTVMVRVCRKLQTELLNLRFLDYVLDCV